MNEQFKVAAVWKDDCQGKKDYDGFLVLLSTRYWPGPEVKSNNTFDTDTGQWSSTPYGPTPSASASININYGEPSDHGYGDYYPLISKDFDGPTETDVKRQVEEWAQEQFDKINKALQELYK